MRAPRPFAPLGPFVHCVRLLALALTTTLAATASHADGPAPRGLCDNNETVYFACQVKGGRWLNVCGKAPATLQYRFGRRGAVQLAFPPQASDAANTFWFAHYMRAQTDRVEIRFDNASVEYVLFDYTEQGRQEAGVRVTQAGKEHTLACRQPIHSRLVELKPMLRCDTDSALAAGACR